MACERSMKGKGLITTVEFDVAHFKVHTTMKGRSTYLSPLPSTIIGFFFSIMGFDRRTFVQKREEFLAGAQIIDLKGVSRENIQLLKLKPTRETRTTEEIMVLFRPVYKFAIWGTEDIIKTLSKKIENYDFTFVPYGGVSDFIFRDIKNPQIIENYSLSDGILNSYAPYDIVKSPNLSENGIIYSLPYLSDGMVKRVIMTYNDSLNLKLKVPVMEGVPIYKVPLEVVNHEDST